MAGLGSKSLTIIWTEPALADLDQIADYIALDKPDTANRLVLRIFESVERLAHFPKSGSGSPSPPPLLPPSDKPDLHHLRHARRETLPA